MKKFSSLFLAAALLGTCAGTAFARTGHPIHEELLRYGSSSSAVTVSSWSSAPAMMVPNATDLSNKLRNPPVATAVYQRASRATMRHMRTNGHAMSLPGAAMMHSQSHMRSSSSAGMMMH